MEVHIQRPGCLEQVPGVVAGFTSRLGGVSVGPLASLNLGIQPHERPEHLRTNWERVTAALHPQLRAEQVAFNRQVHGRGVVRVTRPRGPMEPMDRADGLVTDQVGVVLAVKSADCVPVLLAAPGGVGAAHAGWRGVAAGVVPAVVQALLELSGAHASQVVAAIGPHISADVYEVGPEVVEALVAAGLDPARFATQRGPTCVDLGRAVEDQLRHLGVVRVERSLRCTHLDPDLYSFRRDGPDTGRQAGIVARMA